ncbi:PREDICTED: ankyrin repeat-containing protein At3g12360-like [Fragaria vesca subsp. vesca]|uniref:ankyrin repeat-containing protein At3g12360-like n=1 Tax=Fragaria vesca subsp. vesca TaxID=101020 RepID=UPI0002C36A35|nr:PREDICTED: ankyrin repeat-containing protein At3g12360-like [Fragaria vesca subsp. vesca]
MEGMGNLLYEAALEGNLTTLTDLLNQDRLALDRFVVGSFSETPLHVAAMLGHHDFAKEILRRKPELAQELDSKRSSPLHLASAKGYLGIVKELLRVNPDMCYALDRDGRNPIHLAAMKGRVGVLRELVREAPSAARATVDEGGTVFHLCVKHNQLEAIKVLMEIMDDYDQFLNAKDDYGMTILHLAVRDKQIETVRFLLLNGRAEVNAVNANGFTALDVLAQSRRDVKDFDISECLRGAGALRTGPDRSTSNNHIMMNLPSSHRTDVRTTEYAGVNNKHSISTKPGPVRDWISKRRDALMVVASLIATMAFQSGLNPPGGLWQDDLAGHQAGQAIMAFRDPKQYYYYLSANTIGFIASLSIILLLVTGLPFQRRFFMWLLTGIMNLAITSIAFTYAESIFIFTPKDQENSVKKVIKYGIFAWSFVMSLLLLLQTLRLLEILTDKLMPKRRDRVRTAFTDSLP